MTQLLIQQVLIMFLLSAVGYLCFRANKITMEGCRTISNILIYLSLPYVIINSFLVEFSKERLTGLICSSIAALHSYLPDFLLQRCNLKLCIRILKPGIFWNSADYRGLR